MSVTRRVKELKGFVKVLLQPGEQREITLSVGEEELSLWDIYMNFIPEPGDVKLMVQDSDTLLFEQNMTIFA